MIILELRAGRTLEVEHSLRVGRDPAWSDLTLQGDQVSRYHLEIRSESSGYRVWDMGSRNGTTVNGKAVGPSGRLLTGGDHIGIGNTMELAVRSIVAPTTLPGTTVAGPASERLVIQLRDDHFVIEYTTRGQRLRDTIPFKLGLALSMLALHRRDGLGPVSDEDFRAIVWRGDSNQMVHGDINRILLRLREWFRDRGVDPPPIIRPRSTNNTRLDMRPTAADIQPEGWLYRYFDPD